MRDYLQACAGESKREGGALLAVAAADFDRGKVSLLLKKSSRWSLRCFLMESAVCLVPALSPTFMKSAASRPLLSDSKWKTYTAAGAAAAVAGFVGTAQAAITFLDFNDVLFSDALPD